MSAEITIKLCEEKHKSLDGWVNGIETRVNKMDSRIWLVLIGLFGNLAGVVALLVK